MSRCWICGWLGNWVRHAPQRPGINDAYRVHIARDDRQCLSACTLGSMPFPCRWPWGAFPAGVCCARTPGGTSRCSLFLNILDKSTIWGINPLAFAPFSSVLNIYRRVPGFRSPDFGVRNSPQGSDPAKMRKKKKPRSRQFSVLDSLIPVGRKFGFILYVVHSYLEPTFRRSLITIEKGGVDAKNLEPRTNVNLNTPPTGLRATLGRDGRRPHGTAKRCR